MSNTRLGSKPAELYLAVGLALSWWEASEDFLMGIFRRLCAQKEPTAFETYLVAPRQSRSIMLLSAIERHVPPYTPGEKEVLISGVKRLEKLASKRNQIARGYVVTMNKTVDGEVVMQGGFLVSALNAGGVQIVRDPKYSYTASEIDFWRDEVRAVRGTIMDAEFAAIEREQNLENALDSEEKRKIAIARGIADGNIPAHLFSITPKDT